jgi:hypothetical protein
MNILNIIAYYLFQVLSLLCLISLTMMLVDDACNVNLFSSLFLPSLLTGFPEDMSLAKQIGLVAAGCQPWNSDVCVASGDRFAYCATLAIYIYQVKMCVVPKLILAELCSGLTAACLTLILYESIQWLQFRNLKM